MSTSQETTMTYVFKRAECKDSLAITQLREPLDGTNWDIWHSDMCHVLRVCKVLKYIEGMEPKPRNKDPEALVMWEHKDGYAWILISNNVTCEQKIHLGEGSAEEMWKRLAAIHEIKGATTAISLLQNFHSL